MPHDYRSQEKRPEKPPSFRRPMLISLILFGMLFLVGSNFMTKEEETKESTSLELPTPFTNTEQNTKTVTSTPQKNNPKTSETPQKRESKPQAKDNGPSFVSDGISEWETIAIEHGDNLSVIFERLGLSAAQLQYVVQHEEWRQAFEQLYAGQTLEFLIDEQKNLRALRYEISPQEALLLTRKEGNEFISEWITAPVETQLAFANVVIDSSLFLSGQAAGLNDHLIMQIVDVFAWDIDFVLDMREGDQFTLLYEEYYVEGVRVGTGPIIAITFNGARTTLSAIRYVDPQGRTSYFTPEGLNMRKAFIRNPVDFTRISSHFNLKRRHPVLQTIRAHRGTDYAAPVGTPIKAAGDGKIIDMTYNDSYGYYIEIQHGSQYQTLYAHMTRFAKNLKLGSTVSQGQVIGYVGSTGLATGPHLHYEFRVNGVHRDPLKIELPSAQPIAKSEKAAFLTHASDLMKQLSFYQTQWQQLNDISV